MEINSINIQTMQTGQSQKLNGSADSSAASQSRQLPVADSVTAADEQTSSIPAQHAYNSLTDSNFIKDQIEKIMFSFPPYFPIGSPQRIDLIKGVKGVQDEIKSSSLPEKVKAKMAGQTLKESSTDKEISTALTGVKQYTDTHSAGPSQSKKNSQPVEIVSIKI